MKRVAVFFLIFQIVALHGESGASQMRALIPSARADAERYAAPWELLYPKSCKELKNLAEASPGRCIAILTAADVPYDDKRFLIYILSYEADFERYADVLASSAAAYLKSDLAFPVLECMFVNMHIKQTMRANHKNHKIQAIAKQCLKADVPKAEKRFFKDLRRGKL